MDTLDSDAREERELSSRGVVAVGVTAGLLGGIALAAPVVIWDWVRTGQRALELPMAATSWLFGLDHFSHDENLWGSIVLGAILLAVYWAMSGIAFTALAERVEPPLGVAWAIVAGAAWSFASFIFFWYMNRAERIVDPDARYAAWGKIDQEVTRTAGAIPWLWEEYPTLFSSHVTPAPELWNGGAPDPTFMAVK